MTQSINPNRIWAVVPARSGSKGLPGKNIRDLDGTPLISHAIRFAQASNLFERVLLSTDSEEYAHIGQAHGAWVPFLRGAQAASDTAMEEHILADLDANLKEHDITPPDVLVWLRPTFPFRALDDLQTAVSMLDSETDSVRLVTEGEPRLYRLDNDHLKPEFDDQGRSMIRRQEFPQTYKVYHTDIFWYKNIAKGDAFLGSKVKGLPVHKLCAMDVDGIDDFQIIEAMMKSRTSLLKPFIW